MSLVVIGLSIGMLLFLLAAGLTVIFGMLGVVNFAHGALYMLGAYVAYQIVQWTNNFWLALLFGPCLVAWWAGSSSASRCDRCMAATTRTSSW